MPTFVIFHEFKKFIGDGTVDLDSHTFNAMLSNTAPDAISNMLLPDIAEIPVGFGYFAGGVALTGVTWLEIAAGTGVWRFNCSDISWTASGGTIGPFRYLVLYDLTAPTHPLVGYVDYGITVTITSGNTFVAVVGGNGLFQLT